MRILLTTLLLLCLFSNGITQQRLSPALASLVAAERAFARTSVEKGVRASFLEFFADEGITFEPHPTKTREALLKRPAPPTKPPFTLNWSPAYADISQAGDLGYTTGPYTLTDESPQKRPPRYGFYFSIWKRQSDGAWKVVIDCGVTTPDHSQETFEFQAGRSSQTRRESHSGSNGSQGTSLFDMERQFLKAVSDLGLQKGYENHISLETRLDRNDWLPIVGRAAIQSYLAQNPGEFKWEPIKSDVSQSNDLGYTYGNYEIKSAKSNGVEKGYYVRVWKRNEKGQWKVVLDTLSPVPPSQ
jgi:ketosteroid isomerase-like protein